MKILNRLAFASIRPGIGNRRRCEVRLRQIVRWREIQERRAKLTELLFGKSVMYIDSLLNGFAYLSSLPAFSLSPRPHLRPSRANNAGMIGSRCLLS